MPLEKVGKILRDADKRGYAVAAFNLFNYETIAWAIEAAEREGAPVIAMLYPACKGYIPFSTFASITRDLADKASVPVGLHLDHSTSYEEILESISVGFTSVMFDGSRLHYDENIRATAEVAKAAHGMGVDVEAELGYVGSAANMNDYINAEHYTKPEAAADFIDKTGVDSLAVAIGSAHGNYASTPRLDLGRLEEINGATDLPLVLHGGSGIPEEQIKAAVRLGINKLNIGTEVNQIFYSKLAAVTENNRSKPSYLSCMSMLRVEMVDYLRSKIRLLRP